MYILTIYDVAHTLPPKYDECRPCAVIFIEPLNHQHMKTL
jgi:hypothetical protein